VPHPPKPRRTGQTVHTRGSAYATCCALHTRSTSTQGTRSWDSVYCCPTAAKPPVERAGHSTFLRYLQVRKRADERTRTADLLITSDPSRVAGGCKCRIFRGVSFLRFAVRCTVLRSRWCQSGVNIAPVDRGRRTPGELVEHRLGHARIIMTLDHYSR
jgi:hypothetical protein